MISSDEFEQTPGDSEEQGSRPWGHKGLDVT